MSKQNNKEWVRVKNLDQDLESDVKSFGFRETLTSFSVTGNELNLSLTTYEPKLKNCFLRNNDRINKNLKEGYAEAMANNQLIGDYRNYRINLWKVFLEVLKTKDIVSKEEPTVVTLDGVLASIFYGFTKHPWTFYGLKFKGVIYLFNTKYLRYFNYKHSEKTFDNEEESWGGFIGSKLISLITGENDLNINMFTKYFNIDRIDFKDNKLIVLNEIDAFDRNGKTINAICKREWNLRNPRSRQIHLKTILLQIWSLSMVRGIHTIVLGNRDQRNDLILRSTHLVKVESIPSQCRDYWTEAKRFSIFEQTMDFIKSCIDSETGIYEFQIKEMNKIIVRYNCDKSRENYFLTKDYKQ